MAVYSIRERRNEFHLGKITNSLRVMKLNAYETLKWNFELRVGVSSKFDFILRDRAILETTPSIH
jgi:hypothetical protein